MALDMFKRLFFLVIGIFMLHNFIIQVLSGKINLSPNGMKRFKNLATFQDKLQFTLIHLTWPVISIVILIILTIFKRLTNSAIDPSQEADKPVYRMKSILTNSFEQLILSAFSQIIVINYLSPRLVLTYIPLMNLLFVIGRLTFYIGYPKYRSFGFISTFVPTIIAISYSGYEFLSFVNLVN